MSASCSRGAVDADWIEHTHQIGQTAPLTSISNVTFVGDLSKIVPMLTKKVKEYKEKLKCKLK